MAKLVSARVLAQPSKAREFKEEDYATMWLKDQLIVKACEALKVPVTVTPSKDGKTAYVSNETIALLDVALFA